MRTTRRSSPPTPDPGRGSPLPSNPRLDPSVSPLPPDPWATDGSPLPSNPRLDPSVSPPPHPQ